MARWRMFEGTKARWGNEKRGERGGGRKKLAADIFFVRSSVSNPARWLYFARHATRRRIACMDMGWGERKGNRFFLKQPIRLRAAAWTRSVTHNKHAQRHDGIIYVVILQCRFFSKFYSSLRLNVFSLQVSLCRLFFYRCHLQPVVCRRAWPLTSSLPLPISVCVCVCVCSTRVVCQDGGLKCWYAIWVSILRSGV